MSLMMCGEMSVNSTVFSIWVCTSVHFLFGYTYCGQLMCSRLHGFIWGGGGGGGDKGGNLSSPELGLNQQPDSTVT